MAVILSSLMINADREMNGDWVPFPAWEGVRFRVRSTNYAPYKAALKAKQTEAALRYPKGVPDAVTMAMMGELVAEHLLLEWQGFDVDYSPNAAMTMLSNPEFRTITGAILQCAETLTIPNIRFTAPTGDKPKRSKGAQR